jgi:hypothetical protein
LLKVVTSRWQNYQRHVAASKESVGMLGCGGDGCELGRRDC